MNGDKSRILLIIDTLSGGGAELVVANLCKAIDRRIFTVKVCALKMLGGRGEELREAGYDVTVLPEGSNRAAKYLNALRLKSIVDSEGIVLIHSHSTQGLVDGGLVKLMHRRVKHVHTFHYGNYPRLDAKSLFLEKVFVRLPDQLIAVGEEQKLSIRNTFRLNGGRIKTIWNGIEIMEKQGQEGNLLDTAAMDGRVTIGSISTLIEQKGLTYLLDAVAVLGKRRRDFRVWIVGEGPLRGKLEERKRALGLGELVEFKGWVHHAPAVILPKLDIFVQSSLWEAMSMVILEAMAAGKAVVATEVGDNGHVIENGVNGILVSKRDAAGMADKLEALIENERLRKELGENARLRVLRDCSVEQMARNHERMYQDVLNA